MIPFDSCLSLCQIGNIIDRYLRDERNTLKL